MKRIIVLIMFLSTTMICYAQSLFFDNLENTQWLSVSVFADSIDTELKQIPLGKLTRSLDSLQENLSVWSFKDSVLTISLYDAEERREEKSCSYNYQAKTDKRLICISINSLEVTYKVGSSSTGDNVLLIRTKKK